ncbi:cell division protein CrgA [Actinomyces naeslundii]|uniref:cell division protein CrgA n=1 Tax=Actinomyces naeslundii TaxID=1655 RepID=UPI00096F95CD|nr:cell division protein CrgA [Actinomyces naeslundii]OMG21065.1 septation inhibitor protein [Actinomyces naeslundii]OMG23499.1 septation inhibitor protein [Actinomyces naeslundii]OMG28282.1 septation inhibitor protein [Actinomyces naeslundii]OMG28484.1 septation inhibitor protein [Actinomyces naeslundii]OMG32533.1 septation inhibitor protein [Actinomyces naeslundii]
MALEKKSTKDDADKSSEKVSKKSAGKNSSEKNTEKSSDTAKKSTKKDKDAKKSSSSKKHPERSGNPAKAAKALEEESRAAANRVSRTPTKVKDTASPRWYAPTMVTLMVIGLLWVVTTYLFNGQYPLPYFTKHHATDWLLNGNLYIGFLIMMSGFLGLLRWK